MRKLQKENFTDRCFRYLSTCFGLGFVSAPGTAGSIFTTVVHYIAVTKINPSKWNLLYFDTILIFILFAIGLVAITSYTSNNRGKKDPKEIILDEVIGQLIAFNLCNALISSNIFEYKQVFLHVSCLCFFRLFDILKPWPISFVDRKINNAFGIIADDVLAGLCAGLSGYYLIVFTFSQS